MITIMLPTIIFIVFNAAYMDSRGERVSLHNYVFILFVPLTIKLLVHLHPFYILTDQSSGNVRWKSKPDFASCFFNNSCAIFNAASELSTQLTTVKVFLIVRLPDNIQ